MLGRCSYTTPRDVSGKIGARVLEWIGARLQTAARISGLSATSFWFGGGIVVEYVAARDISTRFSGHAR